MSSQSHSAAWSAARFVPAIVALSTGAVLFGPGAFLTQLGLDGLLQSYRSGLGAACLLAAATVVVGQFLPWVFEFAKMQVARWWRERRGRRRMHALTRSEKNLLKQYVTRETRTLVLDVGSSATSALLLAGIIYRAVELDDKALGLAFNIHPWALRYLKDNRHLLETSEVSNARIRTGGQQTPTATVGTQGSPSRPLG